jgi:hypothetical protein
VTLHDGQKRNAYVHSTDPKSDIALLKFVDDGLTKDLPTAILGKSSKLRPGGRFAFLCSILCSTHLLYFIIDSCVALRCVKECAALRCAIILFVLFFIYFSVLSPTSSYD